MPCGLVLPAARANVTLAARLPDVRDRALSYWYTLSVALSTTHRCCWAPVGSRVMPVGEPPPPVSVQLPWSAPAREYLNTLSVVESLTTQMDAPSVTRSFGLLLPLLRAKLLAGLWLPERR